MNSAWSGVAPPTHPPVAGAAPWPPPSAALPPPPPPPPGLWAWSAPPPPAPSAPPVSPLPLAAAMWAVGLTVLTLVASRVVVDALIVHRWPIAVYVALAGLIGYGPLVVFCVVACRRWGTGRLRDDLGFRLRAVDFGWGPLTWLSAFVAQLIVAVVIVATDTPFESNTEGIGEGGIDRSYVIAFAVLAVVCAPLVEELVFRGVVMRGLASKAPAWLAVGVQGILFGCAHIDPVRGVKNVGLVMVLSACGIVLGGSAWLVRRLAPAMLAHAIMNGIALIVILNR